MEGPLVPIPERSTSPRATSTPQQMESLKALDLNRPIREADINRVLLKPQNLMSTLPRLDRDYITNDPSVPITH